MRSTFSGFFVARDGMNAARSSLEITGQNITNVNTKGYSRQRVDTYSRSAGLNSMRYAQGIMTNIGEGVTIGSISQLRDPYLDVRYRAENAEFGSTETELSVLNNLGYIFDNAVTDDFGERFSDLVTQLQTLAEDSTDSVSENIVKTSASLLVQMFNEYSSRVDNAMEQAVDSLQNGTVKKMNQCLGSIAQLNQAIKSAHVSGNPALELMDARNILLDELSGYANVEVVTKQVDVGAGITVEELSVNLIVANGDKFKLVDNDKAASIECYTTDSSAKLVLVGFDGKPMETSLGGSVTLVDGDITEQLATGELQAYLKMINSRGEFDTPPSTQRGIGYYRDMLDTLANQFATMMNEANSTDTKDKPLFSSNVDGEKISASNIVISKEWQESNESYITSTKKELAPGVDNKDDNSNILYMISLFDQQMQFKNNAGTTVFTGTLQDCVSNIKTTLGLQISDVTRRNKTNGGNIASINAERQSVSGVSLDEEGINLIMYNQALSASSRFMTTLDEAVDTIINRMGVVGR